jgi:hypothetical protein
MTPLNQTFSTLVLQKLTKNYHFDLMVSSQPLKAR